MTTAANLAQMAAPGVSLGFKNRIINGDMRIDQRNAGASVTASTTGQAVYTVDRFLYGVSAASKFSIQQNAGSVTPPAGFSHYLGITSLSSYSSSSTDFMYIEQDVEGFNFSDCAFGTASASPVTLSFYVRSSLTGNFGGALKNINADRTYPFSYTINSANTWERKTITVVGDTTGTWNTTNGIGLRVAFDLGSGSTRLGTAGSWYGANYNAPTGSTSVVGTNGATFYITGVQLEKGTSATSFEFRDYGRELAMCQRYYFRTTNSATDSFCQTINWTSNNFYCVYQFKQTMRSSPSTGYSRVQAITNICNGVVYQSTGVSGGLATPNTTEIAFSVSGGQTGGQTGMGRFTGSTDWIDFSAEL